MARKKMNKVETLMVAGLVALAPASAFATSCTFNTECFESEACSETEFSMNIEEAEGVTSMVTDAETVPLSKGGSAEVRVFVGVTDSAFHLITENSNGFARYTTHIYDGPLMINYLGSCEASK